MQHAAYLDGVPAPAPHARLAALAILSCLRLSYLILSYLASILSPPTTTYACPTRLHTTHTTHTRHYNHHHNARRRHPTRHSYLHASFPDLQPLAFYRLTLTMSSPTGLSRAALLSDTRSSLACSQALAHAALPIATDACLPSGFSSLCPRVLRAANTLPSLVAWSQGLSACLALRLGENTGSYVGKTGSDLNPNHLLVSVSHPTASRSCRRPSD
jgi:hypothetical protein